VTGQEQRARQLAPDWGHWWLAPGVSALARAGLSLDEAKAAAWFEAARRHPDMAKGVRAGRPVDGWQIASGLVWAWSSESWASLHGDQRARLLASVRSPFFLPPSGYSFFPEDSLAAQQQAAWVPLAAPDTDDCDAAVEYVRRVRALERAGFVVGAVNNQSAQTVRYAASAITAGERSFPAADLVVQVATAERETANGVRVASRAEVRVLGRFRRARGWRMERSFRFETVMASLALWDLRGVQSDFICRLRL